MATIVVDDEIVEIYDLNWADKRGDCDKKLCQPTRTSCNYDGPKHKCISQLTGHACKHLVNATSKEKKKIDELMKKEGVCNSEEIREKAIHICTCDTAITVKNNNEAVRVYEQLCGKAEDKIVNGWKSRENIQLACGHDFLGYTTILNMEKEVLSFYYSERVEKKISHLMSDYYIYSLLRKCKEVEETYECDRYTFIDYKVGNIQDGGMPIEGKYFYSIADGTGISAKINYAFAFADRERGTDISIQSVLFRYYYSPEVIKTMISLYDILEKETDDKKIEKCINNNENNILTMLKIQNYDRVFAANFDLMGRDSEEDIYLEEYEKNMVTKLCPDMERRIKEVLGTKIQKDIKELNKQYKVVFDEKIYLETIDNADQDHKYVIGYKHDLLAFEIAQRISELALLAGENTYAYEDVEDEYIRDWIKIFKYTDAK